MSITIPTSLGTLCLTLSDVSFYIPDIEEFYRYGVMVHTCRGWLPTKGRLARTLAEFAGYNITNLIK